MPDWVTPEIMDRLRQLRVIKFDTCTSASPEIVRIAGGTLLGHVLDNFNKSRRSAPPVENGLEVKDSKLMVGKNVGLSALVDNCIVVSVQE